MGEERHHIYRVMNFNNCYTTSPFTNRETETQGGPLTTSQWQIWVLKQVFLSVECMPLLLHLPTSYEWAQTFVFEVRRTHVLETELNWPCFSLSVFSPLLRLGSTEASGLKPRKVLTKDSKPEKTLNFF